MAPLRLRGTTPSIDKALAEFRKRHPAPAELTLRLEVAAMAIDAGNKKPVRPPEWGSLTTLVKTVRDAHHDVLTEFDKHAEAFRRPDFALAGACEALTSSLAAHWPAAPRGAP